MQPKEILNYHAYPRPGKIEIVPSKPCATQRDLSTAYTPGVAQVCHEIKRDPSTVYDYTAKGNLVAVITNGSAVLGLGNQGPYVAKPVMEGKAVLFKRFADIDAIDIELNLTDPDEIIKTVQALEPTFGGINLEDIKAPDCFYIEESLRKTMKIPVFHDDQHGTAIIVAAAFLNALSLTNRKIEDVKIVFTGAGAAATAVANLVLSFGVRREHLIMIDIDGVVYKGREIGMNPYLERLATDSPVRNLKEALVGADAFIGLSVKGLLKPDYLKSMAKDPIVFALANPDPEIAYDEAKAVRPDVIIATGRSDYPNQVNNVLGFPFIFRGALDVRAKEINEEMKKAAVLALVELAQEEVPEAVSTAYADETFRFGRDYLIPKPFDPRALLWVAPAVAKAAMASGVAQKPIDNFDAYREKLERLISRELEVMRPIFNIAKRNPKRIVFPEGDHEKILEACRTIVEEGIARPIVLGAEEMILKQAARMDLDPALITIIDPWISPRLRVYAKALHKMRERQGLTAVMAQKLMSRRNYFGAMMIELGDADGMVSGFTRPYAESIRPILQVLGPKGQGRLVCGLTMLVFKNQKYFFADTAVNIDPTAEQLATITRLVANRVRMFDVDPRVALLSFSNFGSSPHFISEKIQRAVSILHQEEPDLVVDGEMQADTAISEKFLKMTYPFSKLQEEANTLIFPGLNSGSIAVSLLAKLGGAHAIGPILLGMRKPANVVQMGCSVRDLVNVTAFTVSESQQYGVRVDGTQAALTSLGL